MEHNYFIIIDGKQAGPFQRHELRSYGLNPESYIWREGLPNWVKASSLPELGDLFVEESAFGTYAEVPPQPRAYAGEQYGANPYGQPGYAPGMQNNYGAPIPHTNWMPWAILVTVFGSCGGCIGFILGIIAIVKANEANNAYNRGNRLAGDSANSTARVLVIISAILLAISIVTSIVLWTVGGLQDIFEQLQSI